MHAPGKEAPIIFQKNTVGIRRNGPAALLPGRSLSSRSLLNRILAAAPPGQGPDVLDIGSTWSASLRAIGALLPFTSPFMARIGGSGRSLGPSLAATGAAGKLPPGASLCDQAYAPYAARRCSRQPMSPGPGN